MVVDVEEILLWSVTLSKSIGFGGGGDSGGEIVAIGSTQHDIRPIEA